MIYRFKFCFRFLNNLTMKHKTETIKVEDIDDINVENIFLIIAVKIKDQGARQTQVDLRYYDLTSEIYLKVAPIE